MAMQASKSTKLQPPTTAWRCPPQMGCGGGAARAQNSQAVEGGGVHEVGVGSECEATSARVGERPDAGASMQQQERCAHGTLADAPAQRSTCASKQACVHLHIHNLRPCAHMCLHLHTTITISAGEGEGAVIIAPPAPATGSRSSTALYSCATCLCGTSREIPQCPGPRSCP